MSDLLELVDVSGKTFRANLDKFESATPLGDCFVVSFTRYSNASAGNCSRTYTINAEMYAILMGYLRLPIRK